MNGATVRLREWEVATPEVGSPLVDLSLEDSGDRQVAEELTASRRLEIRELKGGLE